MCYYFVIDFSDIWLLFCHFLYSYLPLYSKIDLLWPVFLWKYVKYTDIKHTLSVLYAVTGANAFYRQCGFRFEVVSDGSINQCTSDTSRVQLSVVEFRQECSDHDDPKSCLQKLAMCPPGLDIINCNRNTACWIPSDIPIPSSNLCVRHRRTGENYWIVINLNTVDLGKKISPFVVFVSKAVIPLLIG